MTQSGDDYSSDEFPLSDCEIVLQGGGGSDGGKRSLYASVFFYLLGPNCEEKVTDGDWIFQLLYVISATFSRNQR